MADPRLLSEISGRQWLSYDLEERQALVLVLRNEWIAEAQADLKNRAEFLIAEFQRQDQRLREYECGDQPQEACDRDKAIHADLLTELCRLANADECTEAGMSSGLSAQAEEPQIQESIDRRNCAFQIETMDRVAREVSRRPVLLIALESCGWGPPEPGF